ncbi:MAG TPA: antitoxin [Kribbella sp.]|nr:antitoxin [Kribbella sp.]
MGVFDNLKDAAEGLKDKATDLVDGHGDKVGEGLDKAGDFVDERTGGKYGDQIDKGVGVAKNQLDNLDGQNDDIPDNQG